MTSNSAILWCVFSWSCIHTRSCLNVHDFHFAYLVNSFLNIVIFFKGCQVKSEHTNHQPMTEQDGKELLSTKDHHQPCPWEDVMMQIQSQCTVCHLQSNFCLVSNILKYFATSTFSLSYDGWRDTSVFVTCWTESSNQMNHKQRDETKPIEATTIQR